ncbi:MAG: FHA domain-containing protein [Planctomycetales bacterium]|nr:FHA domain-containing protein [Planctomycetales bacterium]
MIHEQSSDQEFTTLAEYDPRRALDRVTAKEGPSRQPVSNLENPVQAIRLNSGVRPSMQVSLGQKIIVGRMDDQFAVPFDPRMSKQHFLVEVTAGGSFIEDLHSTNGTWLNGVRIQRAPLNPGDTILSGGTVFEVEWLDAS